MHFINIPSPFPSPQRGEGWGEGIMERVHGGSSFGKPWRDDLFRLTGRREIIQYYISFASKWAFGVCNIRDKKGG